MSVKKILRSVLCWGLSFVLFATQLPFVTAKTTVESDSPTSVSWDFTKQEDFDQWKKTSGGAVVTKTEDGMDVQAAGVESYLVPENSPIFQDGYMEVVFKTYPQTPGEGRVGFLFRYEENADGAPLEAAGLIYDPDGTGKVWGWSSWNDGVADWAGNNNNEPEFTTINGGTTLDPNKFYKLRMELYDNHVRILVGEENATTLTTVVDEDVPSTFPTSTGKLAIRMWGYDPGHQSRATFKSVKAGTLNPVSLNPSSIMLGYESAGQEDISIQMTPQDSTPNPLVSVTVDGTALLEGEDYSQSGSVLTIRKEYVEKRKNNGVTSFLLTFEDGSTTVFQMEIAQPPVEEKTYTIDFSKETDLSKLTFVNGEARLEDGALVSDEGINTQVLINATEEFPEFKNGEMTIVMEPLNDQNGEFGIQMCDSGSNWGLFVGIDTPGNQYGTSWMLKTAVAGNSTLLSGANRVYANRGAPYTIKVRILSDVLTLYVDGIELAQTTIPSGINAGTCSFKSVNRGFKVYSVTMSTLNVPTADTGAVDTGVISSEEMNVTLDKNFPRVIGYQLKDGTQVDGQKVPFRVVEVNNTQYVNPSVTSELSGNEATYTVTAGAHVFQVKFTVDNQVLTMSFPGLPDDINSIYFPKHSLVSMGSTQDATLTRQSYQDMNHIQTNLSDASASSAYNATSIAVLSNGNAAAAIFSDTILGNREIAYQTQSTSEGTTTGLWSNELHFRGLLDGEWLLNEEEYPEGPTVRVAITQDRNGDGITDYQDGAIAYRDDIAAVPTGTELVRDTYSSIAMDVGSGVQYPFLRILDNIKKLYLGLDGFGQNIIIKGYQAEGHDSAHPDFANINKRAGGIQDFQKLLSEAGNYNANIGVHINHTETYPEAPQYAELASGVSGWVWYDQAMQLNREKDILSGGLYERLDQLAEICQGNLKMVYVDVYMDRDWPSYKLMSKLNDLGWAVAGEYRGYFPQQCVWAHLQDAGYSDTSLVRLVDSQNREIFGYSNLYRGVKNQSRINGINGWQGASDYYDTITDFYTNILPNKYLMHFPVQKMETDKAYLGSDLSVTTEWTGSKNVIKKDGKVIADGNEIFIPWDPETEDKIYCYSESGNAITWQLPDSWDGVTSCTLYELSDQGRDEGVLVEVVDGSVTLTLKTNTGYVLCKETSSAPLRIEEMNWSDGSVVKDTGFNSHSFGEDGWEVQSGEVSFANTEKGNAALKFDSGVAGEVTQTMTGLEPGKAYSASVWMDIPVDGRRGTITITQNDGTSVSNYAEAWEGYFGMTHSDKTGSSYQRVKLEFVASAETAKITLSASGDDTGDLWFDDVRVTPTLTGQLSDQKGHTYYEDFENVDELYGPFAPYNKERYIATDNTHLSQLNPGVTDDVIDGTYSLKVTADTSGSGNTIRTLPHHVRFKANTEYTVGFAFKPYNCSSPVVLQVMSGDGTVLFSENITGEGEKSFTFTTGNTDDCYIQLSQSGAGPNRGYVLDNFYVDETVVNKSTLEYVLNIANGHVEAGDVDKLVPSAQEVFNKVLASAQAVYDDPDATQEQVDAAWKMLVNVIQAMGFVPGDKTELIDLVAEAKALDLNGYEDGAEKDAFTAALKAAEDLIADPDAMELDIDAAYQALSDAIQNLIPKPVAGDKTELKKVIDEADGKNSELDRYVDDVEAKQKFADALAAAKEVYEKDGATQEEIDQAKNNLIDAMTGLRLRADKDNLNKWLEDLKSIDLSQYTEESAAVVRAVIAKAEALAAQDLDEDDQDLINAMVAEMAIAKAQLVPASADPEDPENPNPGDGSGESSKPNGDASSQNEANSEGKEATDEVPTTGDATPIAGLSLLAIAAAGALLALKKRKKNEII